MTTPPPRLQPSADRIDVIFHNLSQQVDRMQDQLSIYLSTSQSKLSLFYANSILWFDTWDEGWIQLRERLKEGIQALRANSVQYVADVRLFLRNEVSKQAVYFGCAGLLTGGALGLCIGYSFTRRLPGTATGSTYMKAIHATKGREGLEGLRSCRIPIPGQNLLPHEILIQIRAVGIDYIDVRLAGVYGQRIRRWEGVRGSPSLLPLGREASGTILATGPAVPDTYTPSVAVIVSLPLGSSSGLLAPFAIVKDKHVALKPRNVSFEAAATLPYASVTAWRGLITAGLTAVNARNQRILIHLGTGTKNDGVGLVLTQVLKAWGARVVVCTEECTGGVPQMTWLHTLKSLGAESHLFIPLGEGEGSGGDGGAIEDLAQRIYDTVINTDSVRASPALQRFLKDPDRSVVETFPPELPEISAWTAAGRVLWRMLAGKRTTQDTSICLSQIARLVGSGSVVPVVARSFHFSQYDQAFCHVAANSHSSQKQAQVGKTVVVVSSGQADQRILMEL